MEKNKKGFFMTREEFLELVERGRRIKEKCEKVAKEWYEECQRRKQETAESEYYDIEWV